MVGARLMALRRVAGGMVPVENVVVAERSSGEGVSVRAVVEAVAEALGPGLREASALPSGVGGAGGDGSEASAPAVETSEAVEPGTVLYSVFFFRHGLAGDRDSWEGPDEARPLTGKGRRRLRQERRGLREAVGGVDVILSSPYARAQETAEIVARNLRHDAGIVLEDTLVHGGDARVLPGLLARHPVGSRVMLVGHSPDLERWISFITTGRLEPPFVELRKGGVCRVDVERLDPEPRGRIRWVLTPSVLRSLE